MVLVRSEVTESSIDVSQSLFVIISSSPWLDDELSSSSDWAILKSENVTSAVGQLSHVQAIIAELVVVGSTFFEVGINLEFELIQKLNLGADTQAAHFGEVIINAITREVVTIDAASLPLEATEKLKFLNERVLVVFVEFAECFEAVTPATVIG